MTDKKELLSKDEFIVLRSLDEISKENSHGGDQITIKNC